MRRYTALALFLLLVSGVAFAGDGNRLTYLDEDNPYYVGATFPKLVTPQWVGDEGVEAVVVLAIDDMRDPAKYEAFLRPILRRLKQIDGRAPLSIMTNQVQPNDPRLQAWLKEGLSLEVHTIDHPCPLLAKGDFPKAQSTYERCVDLMASIPNNRPVAFRMPCCDSLNTVSPRFFTEIFNRTTAGGKFLTLDSSVFNVLTSNDPKLPRELVVDPSGRDRFLKYIPFEEGSFVNTIENYPYPYVISRLCWELPCVTPSDWEAKHYHKPNNPVTVRDLEAALDAIVLKQGVMNLVFHPHGWIRNDQVVELIDHAVAKHGKKVKFLTFREVQERIDRNLLQGQPLRAANGDDNGVRLLDVNNDGFMDVVIGNGAMRQTRIWSPKSRSWTTTDFPCVVAGARFGVLQPDGAASVLMHTDGNRGVWHFADGQWCEDPAFLQGLECDGKPVLTAAGSVQDLGVRLRDLDGDGRCELLVANETQQAVFQWSPEQRRWNRLGFNLPPGARFVDGQGKDAGLRFVDLNSDLRDDVLFSNENGYGVYLFTSMQHGWSQKVSAGKPGDPGAVPMISRHGTNNGAWFHSRHLWVQNENTALLKNLVDRRSYNELAQGVEPEAKTAEASWRSIQTRPGFTTELMVAEPLVEDPIAMAWGPDGKLWVVEMADYPLGLDGKGKPGSRVKFLEDTKGTGTYDKATLFLDNLPFATGVTPWRRGVLITCAPDIFYAEDTNGDGKADVRKVLFTGFFPGNQQHRLNGLVWGLDNWLYGANGESGGLVKSLVKPDLKPMEIRGRDFRVRPDDGMLDTTIGQTQFGRSRDDWGNWFGNNNSNPLWHFALDDQYLRRNPYLTTPNPRINVSVTPGAARVYPISPTLPRFNDLEAANHFTSACSAIIYRDTLFGPNFAGNSFVSEPVHNLVHREIVTPTGITFSSHRADDELHSEFWASTDNWTRPTTIQTGPDGALWIADMYRQVIEHPEWIPRDWQKRLDLRAGHDKGRLYRVYPTGTKPRAIPRLDRLDTAGLVAALDSPSGWQRDMAQQMLLWQNDPAAVSLLEKAALENANPLCRLHALCTLDGLHALTPAVARRALDDAHPGVRRHAVRLSEPLLASTPELGERLVKLAEDPDAQVRMQVAYSLGAWDDPRAARALGLLALREGGDRYLLAAVQSSLNPKNIDEMLLTVFATGRHAAPPATLTEELLRLANRLGNARTLAQLLERIGTPDGGRYASWQWTALAGMLDALDQRGTSLAELANGKEAELKPAVARLAGLFTEARAVVGRGAAPAGEQLQAIRLLGRGIDRRADDIARLAALLAPQTPAELQGAAVGQLGLLRDAAVPGVLLRGWQSYGPAIRGRVLDTLLQREAGVQAVLDALDRKQMLLLDVDAVHRQRLLEDKASAVRERAAKLFASAVNADRQKVVEAHKAVLQLQGDSNRGAQVFAKICATCHVLGNVGHKVGPDLASLGDKSPASLLIAILDPNRAVEARYVNYVAVTKTGLTFVGVLANESSNSVTLVASEGKEQTISRSDLEELVSSNKSAMPEGLEKDLKPQDLADVIAFVGSATPPLAPKVFAGNKPELVKPGADGTLRLRASNCAIFGPRLILEEHYGNLGFWANIDDRAIWTVDVARGGRYAVWFEYACADTAAGNGFQLQAGIRTLDGKVKGTGTWDDYKELQLGTLELDPGRQPVILRSVGRPRSALLDLKGIRLAPVQEGK